MPNAVCCCSVSMALSLRACTPLTRRALRLASHPSRRSVFSMSSAAAVLRPLDPAPMLVPPHLQAYVRDGSSPFTQEQLRMGERHRAALATKPNVESIMRRLRPADARDTPFVEPKYDPKVHLQLQTPKEITTLEFKKQVLHNGAEDDFEKPVPLESPSEDDAQAKPSELAYTSCFRVLSDEGIRVLRGIISAHGGLVQSNSRIPCMIRNLGYASEWIRDFNQCPVLLAHLSKLAGQQLLPTYIHGSYSHVNVGVLPPGQGDDSSDAAALEGPPGETEVERAARLQVPVDQWHADSVPFVLIVVLSDMEGMIGGEIECVRRRGREAGMKLIAETGNAVPKEDLLTVSYERMGYALFMQGCDIVHHVTPVLKAKEPRITCVNSYMPRSPLLPERHVYASFAPSNDPADFSIREGAFEYARGRAIRHAGHLQHVANGKVYEEDPVKLADQLEAVAADLAVTISSLRKKPPSMRHFDERKAKEEQLAKSKVDGAGK